MSGVTGKSLQQSNNNIKTIQTMKANDLSNFTFRRSGSGCYNVTYVTGRGAYYDDAIR